MLPNTCHMLSNNFHMLFKDYDTMICCVRNLICCVKFHNIWIAMYFSDAYSSFAPSSPFLSSWWQKDCLLCTHILVLQCSPSTSSRQPQTVYLLIVGSHYCVMRFAYALHMRQQNLVLFPCLYIEICFAITRKSGEIWRSGTSGMRKLWLLLCSCCMLSLAATRSLTSWWSDASVHVGLHVICL